MPAPPNFDAHKAGPSGSLAIACLTVDDHLRDRRSFWLDLQGPSEEELERLGRKFNLHPLTIEDAQTFSQRPKYEEYGSYVFLVVYGVDPRTTPVARCFGSST